MYYYNYERQIIPMIPQEVLPTVSFLGLKQLILQTDTNLRTCRDIISFNTHCCSWFSLSLSIREYKNMGNDSFARSVMILIW